jgi:hypothetical protein
MSYTEGKSCRDKSHIFFTFLESRQLLLIYPTAMLPNPSASMRLAFLLITWLTFNYSFGTVATLLELIPVASIFFSFTNTGETLSPPSSYKR